MENAAAFDLNRQITLWRDSLKQTGSFQDSDLEELELHLRESIEQLRARSLSDEESFLIAARRLGHSDALDCEFQKVNQAVVWQTRLAWMLAGVFALHIIGYLASATSELIPYSLAPRGVPGHWVGAIVLVCRWVILAGMAAFLVRVMMYQPKITKKFTALCAQRPFSMAGCLSLIAVGFIGLQMAHRMFWVHNTGIPAREVQVSFGIVGMWTFYGYVIASAVICPALLVMLIRRTRRPRQAERIV